MVTEAEQQLRALYDEHAAVLSRYVTRLTQDRQRAEDVVQEVLVRAMNRPAVLDQSQASARAWMFTVARNLVVDDARSAYRRREVGTAHVPELPGPNQHDAVLDQWILAQALLQLRDEHRAVVVGAYYRGMSMAELSAQLEIPAGTVKSRLHYGMRALRLALQEMGVTP